jgi:5-methylcytosine-specific restriction endonuclease McrA
METKICVHCKKELSLDMFYRRYDRWRGIDSYCKKCHNLESTYAKKRHKQIAVDYLGGSCISCGYNKCLDALEFHHKNPLEKDFSIGKFPMRIERLKKELDKCDLLCANCHREIHAR